MKYRFFRVPVADDGVAADEINRFCAGHRVVQVVREFVQAGDQSAWAFCIGYVDGKRTPAGGPRQRIDYREVLDEKDFAVYARLREMRKTLAESDAVPPYAIFTNEQLAKMVQQRVRSLSDLRSIEGIGDARIEKYADVVLSLLNESNQGEVDAATAD